MSLTSAQEGAFDESVKGVDAIAHMASPINNHFNHFDDLNATIHAPCTANILHNYRRATGARDN